MSDIATALSALAAYPVIHAVGALAVLAAGVIAMVRGERDKKAGPAPTEPRWFFDGPLQKIIDGQRDAAEVCRNQIRLLEEIKDVLDDRLPARRRR